MLPISERRKLYRNMTTEEILRNMGTKELRINVRKGGIAAISEMERRTRIKDLIEHQDVK